MIGSTELLPSGLALFAVSYAAVLAVPGPSFVVVSDACIAHSRRIGILTAAGVASGAALLVTLTLQGGALLPRSTTLEGLGGLLHALVLLYVGLRALRRALLPRPAQARGGAARSRWFAIGLATALTNPVSFAFFSSFALSANAASASGLAPALLPTGVFVMAAGWFGLIAILLSLPAFRSLYGRTSRTVDGLMGGVLIALALSPLLA